MSEIIHQSGVKPFSFLKYRVYTIDDVKNKTKDEFCYNCSYYFDKDGLCPCKKERLKRLNQENFTKQDTNQSLGKVKLNK